MSSSLDCAAAASACLAAISGVVGAAKAADDDSMKTTAETATNRIKEDVLNVRT